jgi:hypothetical protein
MYMYNDVEYADHEFKEECRSDEDEKREERYRVADKGSEWREKGLSQRHSVVS